MLSNSEKVIKCMLAMLDGRSGKGYNNYVFLGSIYGVGDVYSDLSIVKRNVSLYDFKSELKVITGIPFEMISLSFSTICGL